MAALKFVHSDNFLCCQWRKFRQNVDIFVSVSTIIQPTWRSFCFIEWIFVMIDVFAFALPILWFSIYKLCDYYGIFTSKSLEWRHNEHDGVSNRQSHDCLLNRLFRRRSKKTSKLRVIGLCEGNSPVTDEFPVQSASNAEKCSIWWRHQIIHTCSLHLLTVGTTGHFEYFEKTLQNKCQMNASYNTFEQHFFNL